jgi:hypothetical protein
MHVALRRGALVAVMGCSLLAWGSPARAECTKDTDCKGDRVCNAGVCTEPRPTSALPPLQAPPEESEPASPPPPAIVRPAAVQPAARVSTADDAEAEVQERTVMEPRSPAMRTAGVVLTAAGAVSLVLTGVFFAETIQASNQVHAECVNQICNAQDVSDFDRERAFAALTYVGVLFTAGFLGSGIPLYFVGKHEVPVKRPATAWWVPEHVAVGAGRLDLTYHF